MVAARPPCPVPSENKFVEIPAAQPLGGALPALTRAWRSVDA